jgi:hypothetical protein
MGDIVNTDQPEKPTKPLGQQINFLQTNQQQIHENIKFADSKAGAVIAANGALLAATYAAIPANVKDQPTTVFAALVVSFFLAIGTGFGFGVIWPRGQLNRARGPGVIDSARINLYGHDEFLQQGKDITDEQLIKQMYSLIYDRAHIDQRKYLFLRISLFISVFGWLSALLFAVWVKAGVPLISPTSSTDPVIYASAASASANAASSSAALASYSAMAASAAATAAGFLLLWGR